MSNKNPNKIIMRKPSLVNGIAYQPENVNWEVVATREPPKPINCTVKVQGTVTIDATGIDPNATYTIEAGYNNHIYKYLGCVPDLESVPGGATFHLNSYMGPNVKP